MPRRSPGATGPDVDVATPPAEAAPATGTGETVLVVDDEPAVRLVTKRILQRNGYSVLEAAGGQEALRVLREHPGPIQLLLSDVIMPEMNGREVAERVRERRPGIKVKDKRARAFDICCQRQRWVQFDGREIRYPYQRGEIVCQNVIYVSLIPLTPNGRSLHPVWAMLGRIFFEERSLVHTIRIAFES